MQQTCASATVHTDRVATRNFKKTFWKWKKKERKKKTAAAIHTWINHCRSKAAILMHSDLIRPRNRASCSYSHTCPHLKSAPDLHTHIFKTTNPLWVGAIRCGNPTYLTVPKSENTAHSSHPLRKCTVFVCFQHGCGHNCVSLHPPSPLMSWIVVSFSFVPLIYLLSCSRDFVSQENSSVSSAYTERFSYLLMQYVIKRYCVLAHSSNKIKLAQGSPL